MISVLSYILCIYDGALLSNSITMVLGWFVVVHFIIVRWGFGTGPKTMVGTDVVYVWLVTLVAILGRLLAHLFEVPTNGWTRRIHISPGVVEPTICYAVRLFKALLVVLSTFGATAAFEYLPKSVVFGLLLTLFLCGIKCVIFYLLFRVIITRRGSGRMPGPDWHLLIYDAAFLTAEPPIRVNLPQRLTLIMAIGNALTILTFGTMFFLTTMHPFWIGMVSWGGLATGTLIAYIVMRGINDNKRDALAFTASANPKNVVQPIPSRNATLKSLT